VLPIAFGLFSLQFPAGLVLYFLISNLWRLGQQEIIMRKITRPGQAAIAATQKDDVIDVEGGDTSAFPRAAGGLRKLFQIPAANGGEPAADSGNGAKNGAKNGAAKPSGAAGAAKGAAAKNSPAKSAQAKGTQPSAGAGASSSRSGASSSARRRNNKKRKRR
jgi:YidC/Oxa1 family membrane protein insertase